MGRRTNANADAVMSLGDHLEELRIRVILALLGLAVGTILCLVAGKWIVAFIQIPYNQIRVHHPEMQPLANLAPADAFVSYMKICLVAGLIVSSPWVFYQIWMFVAAGLYPSERRYVYIAIPFCVLLFISGALLFLFVIAPTALDFFVRFGEWMGVVPMWMFQNYVSFITLMMLVFGVCFQTPVVIFVVYRLGLVSIGTLRSIRKYALFAAFVIGAVATPSVDVISQTALAVPMYLLYELGIILCVLSDRKRARATRE